MLATIVTALQDHQTGQAKERQLAGYEPSNYVFTPLDLYGHFFPAQLDDAVSKIQDIFKRSDEG